jgi:hypothetical protein
LSKGCELLISTGRPVALSCWLCRSLGGSGPQSFRFDVKLSNSAGVLPQLDTSTVGHLLSAFLRRIVVDALEVDSSNVMAVTGDQIAR